MSTRVVTRLSYAVLAIAGLLTLACEPDGHGQIADSQTNWLKACQIDAQCGGLTCLCGVCTSSCGASEACSDLPGATCIDAQEPGAIARCGGTAPAGPGLCLPRCEEEGCPLGQMCVASVCEPVPEAKVRVVVDTTTPHHQTLIGFGASVAYSEAEIVNHPRSAALFDAAFAGLGLDVLRLRNRYGRAVDNDLTTAYTLATAASESLHRAPTIFLSSWSPPAALKANADVECQGNPGTCTLVKTAAGVYDYAGFATFWRESLDAYAAAGVVPSYVGIQNNANWVPTAQELGEACKFLPVEGTAMVPINGISVEIAYPGYAEALAATLDRFEGLATPPKILAPETSDFAAVSAYTPDLDFARVDAIAHHLYGVDPEAVDMTGLGALGDFGSEFALPILQTEMEAEGYDTAVLIHDTLEVEGGAAYLQSNLTGARSGPGANSGALIGLLANDFVLQEPYYAMQHYALHTEPGWERVDSLSSAAAVLASAWVSPDGTALTVILINAGKSELDVKLELGQDFGTSEVTRTVFGALEHGAALGALSTEGVLSLPGRSIVTVALSD